MDLGVREWAYIIGALVIIAVLLDGWRRRGSEHQSEIRVSRKTRFTSDPDDSSELLNPELPGSVRVVEVREIPQEKPLKPPPVSAHSVAVPRGTGVPETAPDKWKVADKTLPILEDELADPVSAPAEAENEPAAAAKQQAPVEMKGFSATPDDAIVPPEFELDAEAPRKNKKSGRKAAAQKPRSKSDLKPEPKPELKPEPQPEPEIVMAEAEPQADLGEPLELIVLNVMSPPDAKFGGREMLEILLACDLRLGSMNIFHRFEQAGGKGREQFSVINSVEPGVFDLDNIDAFETPGIGFFMRLPGPEQPMEAFECMLETARCLVKNLDGQLLDDRHSAATGQTIEHYRQRIRDFERKQLTLV